MNVLHIKTSINGDASKSNQLSNSIIEKLKNTYSECAVETLDLSENPLPFLTAEMYQAFSTPKDARSLTQLEVIQPSDMAIKQLKNADILVLAVPLYNFSIPANLKAWLDQIARANETFSYATGSPQGLLTGKKVYLAIASGGIYSEGMMKAYDFTENYLRTVLGFMGLTDVSTFRLEGIFVPNMGEQAVSKALETVEEYSF
ncbi:FMN-dependent NADH-azoreductase [Runella defluvii]|uniref:FMN dependent NADH:quinone oxidoreductase n=1 Tax=Runella defluvii TaxID=370973 RepID=A0A7W5ZTC3_9BACT|nr:NAD(P)H-dependent oxidoreductase [Runella defluvii]MBB3841736.1 FMN-dependent NADH-azoreductase [Runella defluvii]